MNPTNIDKDLLSNTFAEYLRKNHLRNTTERDAIFAKVCATEDTFTIDMILQQLEDENFHVSRASVYNTVELLINSKIVVRHQFSYSNVQYELKQIADENHHIVCTDCGTVRKIKNEKLNKIFEGYKIPKFTKEYYSLNIYGICSKCKYKQLREDIKRRKNEEKS
jgi:Fur family ferric uptake transcriptional regulator